MDCRYVGGPGLLPGRVRVGQRGGGEGSKMGDGRVFPARGGGGEVRVGDRRGRSDADRRMMHGATPIVTGGPRLGLAWLF